VQLRGTSGDMAQAPLMTMNVTVSAQPPEK